MFRRGWGRKGGCDRDLLGACLLSDYGSRESRVGACYMTVMEYHSLLFKLNLSEVTLKRSEMKCKVIGLEQ